MVYGQGHYVFSAKVFHSAVWLCLIFLSQFPHSICPEILLASYYLVLSGMRYPQFVVLSIHEKENHSLSIVVGGKKKKFVNSYFARQKQTKKSKLVNCCFTKATPEIFQWRAARPSQQVWAPWTAL